MHLFIIKYTCLQHGNTQYKHWILEMKKHSLLLFIFVLVMANVQMMQAGGIIIHGRELRL